MRYSEYSETDRFLDELFAEDAEFGWACDKPQHEDGMTIVVSQEDNSDEPEVQYVKSLVEEIKEKLDEVANSIGTLSDDADTGSFFTKEHAVQRVIDISNSVNSLLKEFDSNKTAANLNGGTMPGAMPAVIGGGFPTIF